MSSRSERVIPPVLRPATGQPGSCCRSVGCEPRRQIGEDQSPLRRAENRMAGSPPLNLSCFRIQTRNPSGTQHRATPNPPATLPSLTPCVPVFPIPCRLCPVDPGAQNRMAGSTPRNLSCSRIHRRNPSCIQHISARQRARERRGYWPGRSQGQSGRPRSVKRAASRNV